MRKRALSILLILVLALSALPAQAFADDLVDVNETSFPDANFRQYLLDELDKDHDRGLSSAEIAGVGWIDVSCRGIKNLKGIEIFYNLWGLDCAVNELTSLDVSRNTALKELYCYSNKLTSLDVSKNTELKTLRCQDNRLSALDVSKNTKLTYLNFSMNRIASVDLSKNTVLTSLQCGSNRLTSLDVTKNTALAGLECSGNQLTKLDLTKCPHLENLNCCGNSIKELDLRKCTGLRNALRDTANVKYYAYDNSCYIAKGSYLATTDYTTAIRLGNGAKPRITSQPKSQTALKGKVAVFTIKAAGESLTLRWLQLKKGGTEYSAVGRANTLKVKATAALNGAKYRCMVRNRDWILFSKAAKLTVASKPKITGQPANASVKAGTKVTFKVKATGGDLKYQWFCMAPGTGKWTKMSKATKAGCSFKAAKKYNGYKFRCLVSNKYGKAYSKAVKLTVK